MAKTKPLLTRQQLAKRLRCNPQSIARWSTEGMPCAERGRGGRASRYDETHVRAWLDGRKSVVPAGGVADLAVQRANREREQAALLEQTRRVREGRLVPAEDVERVWSAHVVAVKAKLMAIPAAYSDRLARAAATNGAGGVEQLLDDAVRDVLRELERAAGGETAEAVQ